MQVYANENVHFVELIYMLLSLTVQLIRADSIKNTYRNEAFLKDSPFSKRNYLEYTSVCK
jgi:hypothetical protein